MLMYLFIRQLAAYEARLWRRAERENGRVEEEEEEAKGDCGGGGGGNNESLRAPIYLRPPV